MRAFASENGLTYGSPGAKERLSLVTVAAIAGVSERVIMQQTGHKNTAMLRRYIREGSLSRENAAAAVGF